MKIKPFLYVGLAALLQTLPAISATLNVADTVTQQNGLYNYSYQFSITGTGLTLDNVFLGSDDLSPLSVAFTFDGAATSNWSWLGNGTPRNYLQFFSTNGGFISSGDVLGVMFLSAIAPGSSQFAIGLNSSTSATSNQITGVTAPTAISSVPEPAALKLFALCASVVLAAGMLRRCLLC